MKRRTKRIIGRREIVDFPDLGLLGIEAKIDTGAYTSSIHCAEVHEYDREGVPFVSFLLLDPDHPQWTQTPIHWPLARKKMVKNSFGQSEERFVIKTNLVMFEEPFEVELSLADRSAMDYPVLLGRKAIRRRFLVDVTRKNKSRKFNARKKKA